MALLSKSKRLQKELGLFDVFAVSSGAMFSSGFFLLPGLAAAKTGSSVVLAYLLAALLMVPAMLSKAELCTAMPRAGGTYYFLDRSLGPMVGTIGGLGTWLVMSLKSAFALIGMGAYLALVLDLPIRPVAVGLTLFFAMLNIVGVKATIGLQSALTMIVLAVLTLFVADGLVDAILISPTEIAAAFTPFLDHGTEGLFSTVGFVIVSYAGLTKVASISEEVKDPERNIPAGMVLSLGVAALLYALGVSIMVIFVPPDELHGNLTPVAAAATRVVDWLPSKVALGVVVLAAIAGFAAAGNAAMMSASRYPLAMARDHLAPRQLAHLHHRLRTPVLAVLLTAGLMIAFILLLTEAGVAKLASSMQLLLFGLVCLAVVVMRESRIHSYDPGFRSPLYPWLQIAGLAASTWLIIEIGVLSMLFTAGIVVLGALWFHWYARGKVARQGAVYHVFARLGKKRFDALDPELRGIMKEKGLRADDPFDEIVARAFVIEATPGKGFDELTVEASRLLAERLPQSAEELTSGFREGALVGATPVSHGAALPHVRIEGAEHPELVLVRVREGFHLPPEVAHPGADVERPVFALFYLASPAHDPSRHLRILAQIAGRVDDDDFLEEWLSAAHEAQLKEVLLRDERYLLLRIDPDGPSGALAGRTVRSLDLPRGCLIALVRRRDLGTLIPSGDTELELGDRLTIIGEPGGLRRLNDRYHTR